MIVEIILAMALAMLCLRLSGFILAGVNIPEQLEQIFLFLPVATLAALIVTSFSGSENAAGPRAVALLIGSIAGWKTRKVWVCLVAGLAGYGLLSAIGWP
jgi:branched-subunit amino acid transport protein